MSKNSIPNIFTFINLSCGIISIIMIFNGEYKLGCLLIIIAALVDRYDGRIARMLNVSSEIGKELDSLADLVSFGVAPSLLLYNLNKFDDFGLLGYILVIIFPIAGAYRLAKYNISTFDGTFTGVPITVTGAAIAIYSLILLQFEVDFSSIIVLTTAIYLCLAYLMVSKLKFQKM